MKTIYDQRYLKLVRLLRDTRKQAGMTQRALAVKLKRSQSFVSKYEKPGRPLDVLECLQVTQALGVDV